MDGEFWWAWWTGPDCDSKGRLRKHLRGPKDSVEELNREMYHIRVYHFHAAELPTRDPSRARAILNDEIAQEERSLDTAMQRFYKTGGERVENPYE